MRGWGLVLRGDGLSVWEDEKILELCCRQCAVNTTELHTDSQDGAFYVVSFPVGLFTTIKLF